MTLSSFPNVLGRPPRLNRCAQAVSTDTEAPHVHAISGIPTRGLGPRIWQRHNTRSPIASRPAFTLLEMIAILSLLGVFALLSMRLFASCIHQTGGLAQAQDALSRWQSATHLLRQDVWGSSTLELQGAGNVLVRQPDGQSATWRVDADGTLLRQVQGAKPAAPYRWPRIGVRSFVLNGPVLIVHISDDDTTDDRQVCFVSQRQLAGGVRP